MKLNWLGREGSHWRCAVGAYTAWVTNHAETVDIDGPWKWDIVVEGPDRDVPFDPIVLTEASLCESDDDGIEQCERWLAEHALVPLLPLHSDEDWQARALAAEATLAQIDRLATDLRRASAGLTDATGETEAVADRWDGTERRKG